MYTSVLWLGIVIAIIFMYFIRSLLQCLIVDKGFSNFDFFFSHCVSCGWFVVQLLSCVWQQAPLSSAVYQSLLRFTSFKSVMLSNDLILCFPLLLLLSVFPDIRVFSYESILHTGWPKYWSFSFSISPSNDYSGLISFILTGLTSLLSKGLSRVFSNTTVQKHQFFGTQPSLWPISHIHTWLLENP